MKTILIAVLGAALLVLPAGAVAKPDHGDKRAAIKQCKAERGKTKATRKAFKAKYHSFSRCVRQNAAEERAEKQAALKNAAKECKAERADADFPATHDGKSFAEFYGTGKHGKNAYGKCVSQKAREHKQAADEADKQEVQAFKNAAQQCAAERSDSGFPAAHGGKSFDEFYGTNPNKRNAFGKCVSGHSRTYTDSLSS
jgi:hypothetical protein